MFCATCLVPTAIINNLAMHLYMHLIWLHSLPFWVFFFLSQITWDVMLPETCLGSIFMSALCLVRIWMCVLSAWLHHTGNRVQGGSYCDTPGFALLISTRNCCPFSMSPHTILLNCHIFPNDFPSSTEKSLFLSRKKTELEKGWIQHAKGLAQLG